MAENDDQDGNEQAAGDDAAPEPILIDGKRPDDLTFEEFDAAIERGDAVMVAPKPPEFEELQTFERIDKFIMGEMTWAELQGVTVEQAYAIAQYGFNLFQEERHHDARTIFEALVLANPYDAYFHNMLGAVYQQLDMTDEAIEEYGTAIELDEEHINAYVNRAELLLPQGLFEEALSDLQKAVALDPDGTESASSRARALADATANAISEIKKMIQQAPANDKAGDDSEKS